MAPERREDQERKGDLIIVVGKVHNNQERLLVKEGRGVLRNQIRIYT